MATFAPSTILGVCQVPFDNTYRNQVYFTNESWQGMWFLLREKFHFTEFLVVRKNKPGGGIISSVKVEKNIDDLLDCNYIRYQNSNHGGKWFYAFITELIYVNEETTEIVFETDVFQTWLFDVEIKESFVAREHSVTDRIGENTVPEPFDYKEYIYRKCHGVETLNKWGYLLLSTEPIVSPENTLQPPHRGRLHNGIYQGLYFYYYESPNELNNFIEIMNKNGFDCVVSITVIPKFCVQSSGLGLYGLVESTASFVTTQNIDVDFDEDGDDYFGIQGPDYQPKNKKMFTSPYFSLAVTNNNGVEANYSLDGFMRFPHINFRMYGDLSANPSVTLIPSEYKSNENSNNFGITINSFPQCAFHSDSYKLWMAKSMPSNMLNIETGAAQAAIGAAGVAATVGGGSALSSAVLPAGLSAALAGINPTTMLIGGGLMAMQGISSLMQVGIEHYKAQRLPNRYATGQTGSNLLTAIGENKFVFYWKMVKPEFAKTIDQFFTMYGYQTNKLKVPNLSSRPHFNYVQTVGVNIVGRKNSDGKPKGIPNDDMQRLKRVFDEGVTLWNSDSTIGDYSVDNSPT